MRTLIRRTLGITSAALLLAAGCRDAGPAVPTTLEIQPSVISLAESERDTVEFRVLDQRGAPMTPPADLTVQWQSDDPSVARVEDGVVTAVEAGETVIRVLAPGLTPGAAAVTVEPRFYEGEIGFEYSGEQQGVFEVSETFRIIDGIPTGSAWAFAYFDPDFDEHVIVAVEGRTGSPSFGDMLVLFIAGEIVAGRTIAWDWQRCLDGEDAWCDGFGFFDLGVDLDDADVQAVEYDLEAGTVVLDGGTVEGHISGTFAADGNRYDPDTEQLLGTIEIRNGAFTVEVVPLFLDDEDSATMSAPSQGVRSIRATEVPERILERVREMRARR